MLDWGPSEAGNDTGHFKQGSDAWKKWRGKGLGSSDAPVLLEVSPWKNLYQLWLEKTDQLPADKMFKGNWATERGNNLEPRARELYNQSKSANMVMSIADHKEHPIFRASFDGIDQELKRIIEIKCPGKVDHQTAHTGEVPEKYKPQCQWLLMVAGYEDLDYVSYDGENDLVIVPVKADFVMQERLKEKALWFWDLVEKRVAPPTEIVQVEDEELALLLEQYDQMSAELSMKTIALDAVKDQIKKKSKGDKTVCGKFTIQWVERIGNVDYSKVPQLKDIDLNSYRNSASRYIKITKEKPS